MEIVVRRFSSDSQSTLGVMSIDGKTECFVLEDEKRTVKVPGETRIPAGRYEVKFRAVESGLTMKYRQRFPTWFKYHLELQGVPNFQYVYIHIGNTDKDSDGCLLVGKGYTMNATGGGSINQSAVAYEAMYRKVKAALDAGQKVFITMKDEDGK